MNTLPNIFLIICLKPGRCLKTLFKKTSALNNQFLTNLIIYLSSYHIALMKAQEITENLLQLSLEMKLLTAVRKSEIFATLKKNLSPPPFCAFLGSADYPDFYLISWFEAGQLIRPYICTSMYTQTHLYVSVGTLSVGHGTFTQELYRGKKEYVFLFSVNGIQHFRMFIKPWIGLIFPFPPLSWSTKLSIPSNHIGINTSTGRHFLIST